MQSGLMVLVVELSTMEDGSNVTSTSSTFANDASPFGGAIENYYGTAVLQYNADYWEILESEALSTIKADQCMHHLIGGVQMPVEQLEL